MIHTNFSNQTKLLAPLLGEVIYLLLFSYILELLELSGYLSVKITSSKQSYLLDVRTEINMHCCNL